MKKKLQFRNGGVDSCEFSNTFGLAMICLEALYPKSKILIELEAECYPESATWEGETELAETFGLLFVHLCAKAYETGFEVVGA